jgi:hypothetical protein
VGRGVAFGRLRPVLLAAPIGPDPNQIFIATMIGSQEQECKDLKPVYFSNSLHSMHDFFGHVRTSVKKLNSELSVWYYPPRCRANRKNN